MAWEWQIESGWFDFAVQLVWNAEGQAGSQTESLWYKLESPGECIPLNLHIAGIKCDWPTGQQMMGSPWQQSRTDGSLGNFNQLLVPWQSSDACQHINLEFYNSLPQIPSLLFSYVSNKNLSLSKEIMWCSAIIIRFPASPTSCREAECRGKRDIIIPIRKLNSVSLFILYHARCSMSWGREGEEGRGNWKYSFEISTSDSKHLQQWDDVILILSLLNMFYLGCGNG